VVGGDHSIAAGSAAGVARALAARGKRLGLIWLDAHSDLHVPTSSDTGNVHGMPVAQLLGRGGSPITQLAGDQPAVQPEHVAIVGARSVDPQEREHAAAWGVRIYTMREIDERGMRAVMQDAIE